MKQKSTSWCTKYKEMQSGIESYILSHLLCFFDSFINPSLSSFLHSLPEWIKFIFKRVHVFLEVCLSFLHPLWWTNKNCKEIEKYEIQRKEWQEKERKKDTQTPITTPVVLFLFAFIFISRQSKYWKRPWLFYNITFITWSQSHKRDVVISCRIRQ